MQAIVKKGLKKSYYKIEQNLDGRVKGKILIGNTVKQNHFKNKMSKAWCTYEEFGVNNFENRLLKKALVFVDRYLPTLNFGTSQSYSTDLFNYINPAFHNVSAEVSIDDVKHYKENSFYREYKEALTTAKLILRRFGYNIDNIQMNGLTKSPPFWIDMSKLFELYVLGILKDQYYSEILYGKKEAKANYGLPDYLLKKQGEQMIIDAKYKLLYNSEAFLEDENKNIRSKYDIENIRQIAGYARDKQVLSIIGKNENDVVKCLIIYPKERLGIIEDLQLNNITPITQFSHFYKLGISLPKV